MPTSALGVAFVEADGSPSIKFTRNGMSAQRKFICPWDSAYTLARELIGSYTRSGIVITAIPPKAFPGFPGLFVSDVQIDPHMPDSPAGTTTVSLDGATNSYADGTGGALVTANYSASFDAQSVASDGPEIPEGTTILITEDLGTESYSTPGRTWQWAHGGAPRPKLDPDLFPGLLLPTGEVNIVWGRVPLPPRDTIRATRGKVNDRVFAGSPTGTLLFAGANIRRMFQFLDNTEMYELTYRFREVIKELSDGTQVGWNYFYREQSLGGEHWVPIENEDGDPLYGEADFRDLFKFDIVTP